jgi:serine protease Do
VERQALEIVRRAVVRVEAVHPVTGQPAGGGPPSRFGFGFIVSENGHVLTPGRLVTHATRVTVTLPDGRVLPATTVVADTLSDLAVLQVKQEGLQAVRLGRSDELKVGDALIALGGSVAGDVVRTVRATGNATGGNLVTDARLAGELRVGLPLVSVHGEVVGIVTYTSEPGSGVTLDFAVPIDRAKRVLRDLGQAGPGTARGGTTVTSDR